MNDLLQEPLQYTKKGTVRKRKPKKSNNYFTEDTQNAIIEYRKTEDVYLRNKIYKERIHGAFYKLVENIIHTFKFYHMEADSIEDLKYEVISFLLQKLDKYNSSLGKAYSYFGTIAKRYLIVYNQKNYKSKIAKIEVKEVDNEEKTIDKLINNEFENELDSEKLIELFIKRVNDRLFDTFQSPQDVKVAISLVEIFEKRHSLEVFNKKLIYIYVKEMVDVPTNTITKVIKKLKTIYKEVLEEHIQKSDF
jgi:hemerythrin